MSDTGAGEPRLETTNLEKYRTRNPLVRRMFDGFFAQVAECVRATGARTMLDAGCGEGETLERLADLLPPDVLGIDINPQCVEFCRRRIPSRRFETGSVVDIDAEDGRFDLVTCLEVLEHLDRPDDALAELARVSRRDIVVSVPHEPWFRLGSLARGKYVSTFGNHPEHVQHWNPRSFGAFLRRRVDIVSLSTAFPWIVAHCRKRIP